MVVCHPLFHQQPVAFLTFHTAYTKACNLQLTCGSFQDTDAPVALVLQELGGIGFQFEMSQFPAFAPLLGDQLDGGVLAFVSKLYPAYERGEGGGECRCV